jgi:hypothetical protein
MIARAMMKDAMLIIPKVYGEATKSCRTDDMIQIDKFSSRFKARMMEDNYVSELLSIQCLGTLWQEREV